MRVCYCVQELREAKNASNTTEAELQGATAFSRRLRCAGLEMKEAVLGTRQDNVVRVRSSAFSHTSHIRRGMKSDLKGKGILGGSGHLLGGEGHRGQGGGVRHRRGTSGTLRG